MKPCYPDATYHQSNGRYFGVFRLPHGRWRVIKRDGAPQPFGSAVEATRAAQEALFQLLFPEPRAWIDTAETVPEAATLLAEAQAFKRRRRAAELLRLGGGRSVVVERSV